MKPEKMKCECGRWVRVMKTSESTTFVGHNQPKFGAAEAVSCPASKMEVPMEFIHGVVVSVWA